MLMLCPLALSRRAAQDVKADARDQFPSVKSSHLTEAVAAGFDYRSNAAMRAALEANRAPGSFSLVRFGKRLCELGYDPPADFLAEDSVSWNAQCLFSLMVAAACQNGRVASAARLRIAESMDEMKEAGCRKEIGPQRSSIPNPAWLAERPGGKQFAQFIDQYGDAIEDIKTATFAASENEQGSRWGLVRSVGFEEPLSEGLTFSLSDVVVRFVRFATSGWVNYSRGDHADSEILIVLDTNTLDKFGVDVGAYRDRLVDALPAYRLKFSSSPDAPMAAVFGYAINMVSGSVDSARLVMEAAVKVWPTVIPSSTEAIKAVDGRVFATLSAHERQVLAFYRDQGRKFGVKVEIMHEGDPEELAAMSREQADQALAQTNSRVQVIVT